MRLEIIFNRPSYFSSCQEKVNEQSNEEEYPEVCSCAAAVIRQQQMVFLEWTVGVFLVKLQCNLK